MIIYIASYRHEMEMDKCIFCASKIFNFRNDGMITVVDAYLSF